MAVSNLSPWQQYLSRKFPGKNVRISPQQFEQAANEFFGPIPVPPGSQLISQSAGEARYIDSEGFEHVLRRSLDGRDPNAGQVQDNTNRPDVLGLQQDPGTAQAFQQIMQLNQRLAGPAQIAQLDPETLAAFEAQNVAERSQLDRQLSEQEAQLIARLFGNRVQQSSIATGAGAQFAEGAGRVRQQQTADQALRALQARLALTDEERQRQALALSGLTNVLGQGTQRQIAGAQIGLGNRELAERARGTNLQFELGQQEADRALAESRSLLQKFLVGSQIAANLAGAASTGVKAYKGGG